jgi:hypothetical protein
MPEAVADSYWLFLKARRYGFSAGWQGYIKKKSPVLLLNPTEQ